MKHVPTEEMFSGWSVFFASQTSKDDHRSSQRLRNHWVVHLDPAKIARCHFLDVTLWGVTFKSTKLYENLGVYIQIKMLDSVGPQSCSPTNTDEVSRKLIFPMGLSHLKKTKQTHFRKISQTIVPSSRRVASVKMCPSRMDEREFSSSRPGVTLSLHTECPE